ncbi:MAG: aminopeptidase [Bdellovibrionaceae bacterium]|nr:aminopeptidase [Pseudobdellovibrionaceae bacterium]|tara:strand:- start:3668 stop:5152 length:1485 start_codon:yes stop_codon:yes gene_type:complete
MNPFDLKTTLKPVATTKDASASTILVLYHGTEGKALFDAMESHDSQLLGALQKEQGINALEGKTDSSAWFQTSEKTYLIVSGGDESRRDPLWIRQAVEKHLKAVWGRGVNQAGVLLVGGSDLENKILAEAAVVSTYAYQSTFSKKEEKERSIEVVGSSLSDLDLESAKILACGTIAARELSILPANYATPEGVVARAKEWANGTDLTFMVYNRRACKEMNMGCFLSVAQGSANEPQMLVMRYEPKSTQSKTKLGIVGKGVTFDTGGINLKTGMPYMGLLDMKADMGGAAATIGGMLAIARLKPAVPVVAVCGLTDNMVSSTATHPGDVVTHASGKTVEIQNTDAEGRLVLSDALHVAKEEGATHLVDAATLTGACMVALGSYYTGLMTNDQDWAKKVAQVSADAGEPTWELPLNYRHEDEIKSDVADLSNMGRGRDGGASTAGMFLRQFVGETPWVHLDIAGSSESKDNFGKHGTAKYNGVAASSFGRLAMSLD